MALIATLFAVLPVLVAAPAATRQVQEAMSAQFEDSTRQMPNLTPEQQEMAMSTAANPLLITGLPAVGAVAGLWIGWLVWAGGLNILSTLVGGGSGFGQFWRTVVWCWVPYTLRGMLQTVYILLTGELISNPGLSGLLTPAEPASGLMAAPPGTGFLLARGLLTRFDLFLVWTLILLALGVMVAARISRRKAFLVTLGFWILLTLLGLLPALLGSMFMVS